MSSKNHVSSQNQDNKNDQIDVPELRFQGFNGEWQKRKLNTLVNRITRKNKNLETNLALTISAEHGLIDQETFFNKKVASKSLENYYLLLEGEFAYNKSYSNGNPWGTVKLLDKYSKGALSTLYICFEANKIDKNFLKYYFESSKWYKEVSQIAVEGARNHGLLNIGINDFFNTYHYIPTNSNEQQKISEFLESIDEKIDLLEKKYEKTLEFKDYVMKQIFSVPNFMKLNKKWKWLKFTDIFKSITTKKYQIKIKEIKNEGKYEVVDQGQNDIAGYSNEKTKLFTNTPIIIYGDHTTFVKFRNKPFIIGADGVKLLKPKLDANIKYLYYALSYFNIKPEGYKRHFSIIKNIDLPFPELSDQNRISSFLELIDQKIKFIQNKIEKTKEFKKYLLQKMFV